MLVKHLTQCLLVAVVAIGISLPSQAAMVGTAQLQIMPLQSCASRP
jgi:hypothetical protein